jgi:hypothetical protein
MRRAHPFIKDVAGSTTRLNQLRIVDLPNVEQSDLPRMLKGELFLALVSSVSSRVGQSWHLVRRSRLII